MFQQEGTYFGLLRLPPRPREKDSMRNWMREAFDISNGESGTKVLFRLRRA